MQTKFNESVCATNVSQLLTCASFSLVRLIAAPLCRLRKTFVGTSLSAVQRVMNIYQLLIPYQI